MAQIGSPYVEKLLDDLRDDDISVRKLAVDELRRLNESSERIVKALEWTAVADSSLAVAKAAHDALRAPVHQDIFKQLRQRRAAMLEGQAGVAATIEISPAEITANAGETGQKNMLLGFLLGSGGAVVLAGIYVNGLFQGGGIFFIAWVAIVFGVIQVIYGLIQYFDSK